MKKKLTFLMFGLLLAVGWTSAQAQKLVPTEGLAETYHASASGKAVNESLNDSPFVQGNGSMLMAPRRAVYNITADVTHTYDWYYAKQYTWTTSNNGTGTARLTDPVTDPYQMIGLLSYIYTNPDIPGILYSEPKQRDHEYPVVGNGWDITATTGSKFVLTFNNSYAYFRGITITDADTDTEILSWTSSTSSSSVGTLPSWFTPSKTISKTNLGDYYDPDYACYMSGGGTITIDGSYFQNHTSIIITVISRTTSSGGGTVSINGALATLNTSWSGWYNTSGFANLGGVTPPTENGYTALIVKLYDGENFNNDLNVRAPNQTANRAELVNYFQTYVKEIQLLTDGLRVEEGTSNAGTVFAYTGDLNRFFFISKGKMAYTSSDWAPFYSMYEEFSPTAQDDSLGINDFYEKMKQGTTYPIVHDCQSVNYMQHYFSMAGKQGTTENRVNSLVFYIPDDRGQVASGSAWRDYELNHQPTVGMYMIDLYADIEPSTTPDYYTVTVNWYDNLDDLTHTDNIPQTYTLYQIMDEDGDGVMDTTVVYTGPDATWTHDYPVGDPKYYDIYYYVIGTPTAATNQDTFFAKSNTDDVTVPGKYDFLGLQWWRYESDYVTDDGTNQEVNYYRNFLAPHALAVQGDIGITAGNVGSTGRTLTLYRKYEENGNLVEKPIMYLDLMMDGTKAMYRIRYINKVENQQIEPGYDENGELNTNN